MDIKGTVLIVALITFILCIALIELSATAPDSTSYTTVACVQESYTHKGLGQHYEVCLHLDGSYSERTTSTVSKEFTEEKRDSLIQRLEKMLQ